MNQPLTARQLALVAEWQRANNTAKLSADIERQLRQQVVKEFFTATKEGANTYAAQGVTIKVTGKVNRTLDKAALDAVMPQLPEKYRVLDTADSIIRYEPTFDLKVYRAMSPDERKIFEQALTIKDGAPSLEIVIAK